MKIFTSINVCLFIMAQCNVWRPITYQMFVKVRLYYCYVVASVVFIVVGIKIVRATKRAPTAEEIADIVYGDDISTENRVKYRFNWLAAFLFQIIIWIVYLIF